MWKTNARGNHRIIIVYVKINTFIGITNFPIFQLKLEGGPNPLILKIQLEGSYNSLIYQLQVEGGSNPLVCMIQAKGSSNSLVLQNQLEGGYNLLFLPRLVSFKYKCIQICHDHIKLSISLSLD